MISKWITIATLGLAAACAPMTDDDLAEAAGDAPYSSDDEEPLEGKQQAVTFDPSCAQWQRDALATANFWVWVVTGEALNNWTTQAHVTRRLRWLGAYGGDLRGRTQAIHNVALAGGPTTFVCRDQPLGTLLALTFLKGEINIYPEFWYRALGVGDNADPVPGNFPPGSQVGIMIHEYAHYVGAPGELMGPTKCDALNSTQAFANADNWRMYLMGI